MEAENTSERLSDSQFGYQSNHYIVQLPPSWLATPSYSDLGSVKAEVQVRTLAQHMWAAASHKLQYKREESVPPPLRRAIYRVSALLETVDLEFARVLKERDQYVENRSGVEVAIEKLNVDNLAEVLKSIYPADNRDDDEKHAELLDELSSIGIFSTQDLRGILMKHLADTMEYDRLHVELNRADENDDDYERLSRGVYFTHVGLARRAIQQEQRLRHPLD